MTHEAGIEAAAKAIGGDEWEYPNDKDRFRWEAIAAIQAYLSASGMVLVPREPTEQMVDVGYGFDGSCTLPELSWERMVAAAPDPFKSKS